MRQSQEAVLVSGLQTIQHLVDCATHPQTSPEQRHGLALAWLLLVGVWCGAAVTWSWLMRFVLPLAPAGSGSLLVAVAMVCDGALGVACSTRVATVRTLAVCGFVLGVLVHGAAVGVLMARSGWVWAMLAGGGASVLHGVLAVVLFVSGMLLLAGAPIIGTTITRAVRRAT